MIGISKLLRRRSLLPASLLLGGLLLAVWAAGCSPSPASPAATATLAPEPTAAADASPTPAPVAKGCVGCHTSEDALKKVAAPTPTPVASTEQQGEG